MCRLWVDADKDARALAHVEEVNRGKRIIPTIVFPDGSFLAEPTNVERDCFGFVVTDSTLQTSVKGCFAAGDVRAGSTKQVASAAGEGATAALMIREYLKTVSPRAHV